MMSIVKSSWRTILAMALLPLVVLGIFVGLANSNAAPRGAIINNDTAANVAGEMMTLGEEVEKGMIADPNIAWEVVDAATAEQGLKDGIYAAAVTIPTDFTQKAASFTTNDASVTKQAMLKIDVSPNTTIVDGLIAQTVNSVATDSVNSALTAAYLDGVMLGFNQIGDSFVLVADGAKQIADGAGQVADGAGELRDGAGELATGANEAREGGAQLQDGLGQLSAGAGELKAGTSELASGAAQVNDGAGQVSEGLSQAHSGSGELLAGLGLLSDGAGQLNAGAAELKAGTAELKSGAAQVDDGAGQISGGLGEADAGAKQLADGLGQLDAGAKELDAGAAELAAGAGDLHLGTLEVGAGAKELSAGVGALLEAVQKDLLPGAGELAAGAEALSWGLNDPQAGLNPAVGYRFSAETLAAIKQNQADYGFSDAQVSLLEKLVRDPSALSAQEMQQLSGTLASSVQQLADGMIELDRGINGEAGLVAGLTGAFEPLAAVNVFDKTAVSQPGTIANDLLVGLRDEIAATYSQQIAAEREKWYSLFTEPVVKALERELVTNLNADATYMVPSPEEFANLQSEICKSILPEKFATCHLNLAKLSYGFFALGAQNVAQGLVGNPEAGAAGEESALEGVKALAEGSKQLRKGMEDLNAAVNFDRQLVPEYDAQGNVTGMKLGEAKGGAEVGINIADTLGAGTAFIATGAPELAAGARQLEAGIGVEQGLKMALQQPGATQGVSEEGIPFVAVPKADGSGVDVIWNATDSLEGGVQALAVGAGQLADGTTQLSDGAAELKDGAGQLKAGTAELSAGTSEAKTGGVDLKSGLSQLLAGARELAVGTAQLAGGAGQLDAGAGELKSGTSELAAGAKDAKSGGAELKSGLAQLDAGSKELKAGTAELSGGAGQLDDGAGQIRDGLAEAYTGSGELADGLNQIADGAGQIADGSGQLADGATELSEGATTLADEVNKGKDEIPTFSDADRKVLSEAGAVPVKKADVVAPGEKAMIGVLLASLLWGIAMLGSALAKPRHSAVVAGVAGGLLGVIGAALGGVDAMGWIGMPLTGIIAGVGFALIVRTLVGWLGNIGMMLAFAILALTVVLAITEGTAPWLRGLAYISPLENGADLFRSFMAGGSVLPMLGGAVAFLAVGVGGVMSLKLKGRNSGTAAAAA